MSTLVPRLVKVVKERPLNGFVFQAAPLMVETHSSCQLPPAEGYLISKANFEVFI